MRIFPLNIQNYLELARFDKPAGALLLMWPCWFGVIIAAYQNADALTVLFYLLLFATGSFVMRGAGCLVNDIIDKDLDAQVERTKTRPLPSGRLTLKQAYVFLGLLVSIGFCIWLCLNTPAKVISLIGLGMMCVYPLMKRISKYPQIFLGFTFNIGSLVAYAAITGQLQFTAYILYAGCIFWTIAYDTIYAHQDIEDDIKTGINSTAIAFGKWNKLIIFICFALFYKMTDIALGYTTADAETIFLLPALLQMAWQVLSVNLKDPQDCMEKFKSNAYIMGSLIFLSITIILFIR